MEVPNSLRLTWFWTHGSCADYKEQVKLADVMLAQLDSGTVSAAVQIPQLLRASSTWLRGNSVGVGEDANPRAQLLLDDESANQRCGGSVPANDGGRTRSRGRLL